MVNTGKAESAPAIAPATVADNFTFRISFSGLCAFVPRGDDPLSPKRMDVLLLANEEYEGIEAYQTHYSEIHHPLIGFFLKNLRGSAENGPLDKTMGFIELAGEDVAFFVQDRATGGNRREIVGGIRLLGGEKFKDKPMPDPTIEDEKERERDFKVQQTSFYWLPKMRSILPAAAVVDSDLVNDDVPSGIVARVRIASGDFGSHALGSHLGGFIVAQFVPAISVSPCRQAIAHWAGAEVQIENGDNGVDVVIVATKYGTDGTENSRELVLRPRRNEVLEIRISNLCCGYYGTEEQGLKNLEPDDDFVRFYELSNDDDSTVGKFIRLPTPVPVEYPAVEENTGGGVDPIRCSGVVFDSVSLQPEESEVEEGEVKNGRI